MLVVDFVFGYAAALKLFDLGYTRWAAGLCDGSIAACDTIFIEVGFQVCVGLCVFAGEKGFARKSLPSTGYWKARPFRSR